MTTFNEFQRELRARGIEGHSAHIFTLLYERMIHMSKEIDNNAKATLALAQSMSKFVALHEATQQRLKEIQSNRDDYVVQSENIDR